jgi:hypothetical protein
MYQTRAAATPPFFVSWIRTFTELSWPGLSPHVGFIRLAALYNTQLGQARGAAISLMEALRPPIEVAGSSPAMTPDTPDASHCGFFRSGDALALERELDA